MQDSTEREHPPQWMPKPPSPAKDAPVPRPLDEQVRNSRGHDPYANVPT